MKKIIVRRYWPLLPVLFLVCCSLDVTAQNWTAINGISAQDISIGKNGKVWMTSKDQNIYRWDGSKFEKIEGQAQQVAVDPEGIAWVVQSSGTAWKFNPNAAWPNSWIRMSEGVRSLAIGANGAIWRIGTDAEGGNYGIYKLNGSNWNKIPGAAMQIAVDAVGNAWVVQAGGATYRYNPANTGIADTWVRMQDLSTNISVGADGTVWRVGVDKGPEGFGIYKWSGNNSWTKVAGSAVRIAAEAAGNLWVINSSNIVSHTGKSARITNNPNNSPVSSNASNIAAYISQLDYIPGQLLSVTENGSNETIPAGGTKDRKQIGNAVIICTKNFKKLDKKMDKISVLKPSAGIIYPGSIILADRNLAEGIPTPITLKKSPLTLSVDLPGLTNNGKRTIIEPKNSTVQAAINEILEEWNKNPAAQGYINAAQSVYEVERAYSSEQLALSLGFRLDWADNFVSAAVKVNTSSEKDITFAFFQQVFYSITMDSPEKPSDIFDPTVTLAELSAVTNSSKPPAYIRSVDYGRTIMIRMETTLQKTSVDLEAALRYAVDPTTKINADLQFKYDNVLKNSVFTVYTVGGNAETSSQLVVGGADLTGLQRAIQKDARYRRDNPGVPLSYTVAFLKDNQKAIVNSSSSYVETQCMQYPNGFIKLVHNGAYVGRFNVTWQEPNANGVLVDAKPWSSGEKTSGYSYTLTVPGDAVNIKLKGEAATGLVWDPWGEAINMTLTGPTNCTYTIYGTTLDRAFKIDCPKN